MDQGGIMMIIDDKPQSKGRLQVKNRFRKYKKLFENSSKNQPKDNLETIFQHLCYTPLQIGSFLKESVGSANQRQSTIESQVQELSQSFNVDSFLSTSIIPLTVSSLSEPAFQQNSLKPPYLREFNRLNSITPNSFHPDFSMKKQMKNLVTLIKSAQKAINHVFGCAMKIQMKNGQQKLFPANNKKMLTLDYFLKSGWQQIKLDSNLLMLKPEQNFKEKKQFQEILNQLDLLLVKTSRYELAASLTQEIGLELYRGIRENLFQIQERLQACSNSIYNMSLQNQYPNFYYKYLQILRTGGVCFYDQKELKNLAEEFRFLWELQEPVTSSQIGRAVWNIIYESQTHNQ